MTVMLGNSKEFGELIIMKHINTLLLVVVVGLLLWTNKRFDRLEVKLDIIYEEVLGHSLKWDSLEIWGIPPEAGN
jgi:hypothetical protein